MKELMEELMEEPTEDATPDYVKQLGLSMLQNGGDVQLKELLVSAELTKLNGGVACQRVREIKTQEALNYAADKLEAALRYLIGEGAA